jgi:hypothetical protein
MNHDYLNESGSAYAVVSAGSVRWVYTPASDMLFHTAKSLASPANGLVIHPLACPTLAHSPSSSSLSLRWR